MVRGKGIKRNETTQEGRPCIRYGEIYTSYNISFAETISQIPDELDKSCIHLNNGDLVFTLTGENKTDIAKTIAYLGKNRVAAGGDLAVWASHGMNPIYLAYYMLSPFCIERKRLTATGSIIVHISTEKVGNFLVPIPPLDEQNRIVAKIEELELFIAQYDRKESELTILNANFPEALKKSILQEAVMGKLVPQDPNDEPASVLLDRIRDEKERLIAEGKIKRDKNESRIYKRGNSYYENQAGKERCIDDELPFEIPENWEWTRFETCCVLYTGNSIPEHEKNAKYSGLSEGYDYIGTKDVSFDHVITYDNGVRIPFQSDFKIAYKNAVLMCVEGGSAGRKISILDRDVCFGNKLCMFYSNSITNEYIFYYLQSGTYRDLFKENMTGIIGGVSINRLKTILLPIPPITEQVRIVAKIESSLKLTGKLRN